MQNLTLNLMNTIEKQINLIAIISIPIKQTFTPIVILNEFSTKIAFKKLSELPESEYEKIIISLLWIFKITDTERRETECKNGCGHYWHNIIT